MGATAPSDHIFKMPSGYSSREDPGQIKKNKQSMADLKLRRLTELNTRLREDLERERIPVSQASKASSRIRTARKTSWYHLSGALLTRRTIHTHHNNPEAAALSCSLMRRTSSRSNRRSQA